MTQGNTPANSDHKTRHRKTVPRKTPRNHRQEPEISAGRKSEKEGKGDGSTISSKLEKTERGGEKLP